MEEDTCGRVKRTGILPAYSHILKPLRLKPNINMGSPQTLCDGLLKVRVHGPDKDLAEIRYDWWICQELQWIAVSWETGGWETFGNSGPLFTCTLNFSCQAKA